MAGPGFASAMGTPVQGQAMVTESVGYHYDGPQPIRPDGPPDHMTVQMAVNIIGTDMRQLLEEIGNLRAQLSPILAERNLEKSGRPPASPVFSRMGAELMDIHTCIQNARELISLTHSQLDL